MIAQHDVDFSKVLAAEMREAGYHVIDCPGPWTPAERCIRCYKGYCPLTEAVDLMIYDPQMTALDSHCQRHSLAIDSALAHPDVPMVVAWSPMSVPDAGTLRAIRTQAPQVQIAPHTAAARRRQVRELIAAADAAAPTPR